MGPNDAPPYIVWDCDPLRDGGCPTNWELLRPTADPDVRHCRSCRRDVHYCRTPADFVRHGESGHCVAIPRGVSPMLRLGTADPAEMLRLKEEAERAADWWDRIVAEAGRLPPEALEHARRCLDDARERGSGWASDSAFLAVVRQAVRDGGIRCPTCGIDHATDEMGVMLLLAFPFCLTCKTPIALDLPPGWTRPPKWGDPPPPLGADGDPPSSPPGSGMEL
jgi:hypothetical protein